MMSCSMVQHPKGICCRTEPLRKSWSVYTQNDRLITGWHVLGCNHKDEFTENWKHERLKTRIKEFLKHFFSHVQFLSCLYVTLLRIPQNGLSLDTINITSWFKLVFVLQLSQLIYYCLWSTWIHFDAGNCYQKSINSLYIDVLYCVNVYSITATGWQPNSG